MHIRLLLVIAMLCAGFVCPPSQAQIILPEPLQDGLSVRSILQAFGTPVRLAYNQDNGSIYYLTIRGDVYRVASPFSSSSVERIFTSSDHGLGSNVLGMAITQDGSAMYLVGTNTSGNLNTGVVMKGDLSTSQWSVFMQTEPYPRSSTVFDHHFNGVFLSPDDQYVFLNSGSRTDHGEEQSNSGAFPGAREIPLTSALFRLPADTSGVILPNNEEQLLDKGFLYADGLRNSFDMAFDKEGNLLAPDNAADRSDNEELNLIKRGAHYGFPWRIGTTDMPQQFPDYDPTADLLLPPQGNAVLGGFYRNDPDFPPPPEGINFVDPIPNTGPDANLYQNPNGSIVAGDAANPVSTFTPHRSPLGLVFDVEDSLPGPYQGKGYILSWTSPSDALLNPFGDEGEDLLMIDVQINGDSMQTSAERLIKGFDNPIDALLIDGKLYVLEFSGRKVLWEIEFDTSVSTEQSHEIPSLLDITAYPNPAMHSVRININGASEQTTVHVFNVLGQRIEVLKEAEARIEAEERITWDVQHIPAGTYFIRVVNKQEVRVLPVIVRH